VKGGGEIGDLELLVREIGSPQIALSPSHLIEVSGLVIGQGEDGIEALLKIEKGRVTLLDETKVTIGRNPRLSPFLLE
jgi:hypothetical protein